MGILSLGKEFSLFSSNVLPASYFKRLRLSSTYELRHYTDDEQSYAKNKYAVDYNTSLSILIGLLKAIPALKYWSKA